MSRWAPLLLLALPVAAAVAGDPPAAPPPPAPVPRPTKLPEGPVIPGVHWEADFEAGLARSTREGRPVFLAVNELENQPGGDFPTPDYGVSTRPYVCYVANSHDHPPEKRPDGTVVCSRYRTGTCAAHQAALRWAVKRLDVKISPAHAVFEPDGAVLYSGEYVQSAPTPSMLDEMLVKTSPRLAMRHVWTAREARLETLSKAPAAELEKAAEAWVAEGDGLAPAGLAALLDQEEDAARRAALEAALGKAGAAAVPVLFDAVDAATSAPDKDPDAALRAARLAAAADPAFGAWAAARVLARARDEGVRARAKAAGLAAAAAKAPTAPAPPAAPPLAEGLASPSRETRRASLLAAKPEEVLAKREAVARALADRWEEVRVAAAIALRRAGDAEGAEVLLAAVGDPVEGPDARAALAALAGADLGEDPAAWEIFVREPKTGGGR
jgi:hypothetical protein